MYLEPDDFQILTAAAATVVGSIAGSIYLAYRLGRRPNSAAEQATQVTLGAHEWHIESLEDRVAELTTQRDTAMRIARDRGKSINTLNDKVAAMSEEVAFYTHEIAERDAARERVRGVQRIRDAKRR